MILVISEVGDRPPGLLPGHALPEQCSEIAALRLKYYYKQINIRWAPIEGPPFRSEV